MGSFKQQDHYCYLNTIWHSYLLFIHNLLPVFNTVLSHFIFFLSDTRASPSHSYGSNPGGRCLLTHACKTSHGQVEGRSHISKRQKKIKSNKNYLKETDSTFLFSFLLVEIINLTLNGQQINNKKYLIIPPLIRFFTD